MLTISVIRDETLEHRLDDAFQLKRSTSLQCNQDTVKESTAGQGVEDDDYFEPLNCKANFRCSNNKCKFVL